MSKSLLIAVLALLIVGCGGSVVPIPLHAGSLAGDYERQYKGDGSKILLSLDPSGEFLIVVDDKATDVYSGTAVVGQDGRFTAICRRMRGAPVTVAGEFAGSPATPYLRLEVSGSVEVVAGDATPHDPGPLDAYAGKYARAIYDTYPPHRVVERPFNVGTDGVVTDAKTRLPIGRVRSSGIISTDETFSPAPDDIFKGTFIGLLHPDGSLFFGRGTWQGPGGESGLWEASRFGS